MFWTLKYLMFSTRSPSGVPRWKVQVNIFNISNLSPELHGTGNYQLVWNSFESGY